jgi:hypothetical protein
MSSDVLKKLVLKTQEPILILNFPKSLEQSQFLEKIKNQIDSTIKQKYDFILLFAHNQIEANKFIKNVLENLNENGIFWFCYPKNTSKILKSDINRNVAWDLLKIYSFIAISQIAIDVDWTALRFKKKI